MPTTLSPREEAACVAVALVFAAACMLLTAVLYLNAPPEPREQPHAVEQERITTLS